MSDLTLESEIQKVESDIIDSETKIISGMTADMMWFEKCNLVRLREKHGQLVTLREMSMVDVVYLDDDATEVKKRRVIDV